MNCGEERALNRATLLRESMHKIYHWVHAENFIASIDSTALKTFRRYILLVFFFHMYLMNCMLNQLKFHNWKFIYHLKFEIESPWSNKMYTFVFESKRFYLKYTWMKMREVEKWMKKNTTFKHTNTYTHPFILMYKFRALQSTWQSSRDVYWVCSRVCEYHVLNWLRIINVNNVWVCVFLCVLNRTMFTVKQKILNTHPSTLYGRIFSMCVWRWTKDIATSRHTNTQYFVRAL